MTEQPYELTSVFGVGFLTADRIARTLERPPDDPQRARAAAAAPPGAKPSAAGARACRCALLQTQLAELLGAPAPEDLIDRMVAGGDLARAGDWIYRRETAELEAELRAVRRARAG